MPNNAHITMHGTVSNDPTNRVTTNGKTELTIRLSVKTTKQSDNKQYQYENDFYDVKVYGNRAETLIPNVKKGTKILVLGDLQMGKPWTDQKGATHITPTVFANTVDIIGGGNWNNNAQQSEDVVPGL